MSNRNPTFLLSAYIPLALSPPARPRCLCLSRFSIPVLSLPFTTDHPREPRDSLLRPLSSSFQPDPRDSHEYSSHDLLDRLEREESSLIYRPFSLLPSSLSLSLYLPLSSSLPLYLVNGIASCRFRSRWKMETSINLHVAVATSMMMRPM